MPLGWLRTNMLKPPKRPQFLSVALPASFTKDVPHLREKTARVGAVGRALAIFRVNEVLIYTDDLDKDSLKEGRLFQKLLSYQETPQYLRRTIFRTEPDLQYVGVLPPLRLPSHPGYEEPRSGLVKEALVVEKGNESKVDGGFKTLVTVHAKLEKFARVTVQVTRVQPNVEAEVVDSSRLPIYWRFRVTRAESTLGQLIRRKQGTLIISTSRKGRNVLEAMDDLRAKWQSSLRAMILFGSPNQGVPEILANDGFDVDKVCDFNLNMIPDQGVETVRTEEALVSTLSIINAMEGTQDGS
jgi:methyltransferase